MHLLDKARTLDVAWYGAAAAAAAAGAALFPGSRIGAGLVGGLAVIALGVWRATGTPCCDGCAGKGAPVIDSAPAAPNRSLDFGALMSGAGIVKGGCSS